MKTDPIKSICNAAMNMVAHSLHNARSGCPLRAAWDSLGTERTATIAAQALRVHMKAVLTDEQVKRDVLDGVPLAADAALASVVADTITDIVEAARVERAV